VENGTNERDETSTRKKGKNFNKKDSIWYWNDHTGDTFVHSIPYHLQEVSVNTVINCLFVERKTNKI